MKVAFSPIQTALLLTSIVYGFKLNEDDSTGLTSITIPVRQLGSSVESFVEVSYNQVTKAASLNEFDLTEDKSAGKDFILVDGSSLTNRLPTGSAEKDVFTIHTTPDGEVWHVDVAANRHGGGLGSNVRVKTAVKGTLPTLKAPIVAEKAKEEVEQSFIQKYWMFIVPMLLVLMLGGGGGGQ
ncbi:hypothetical protein V1514DRAFT_326490 [Lipomyces japonicus]|uniref:uncharacterized protein n=1 Tax=Lipomyces japonicus TaxID=56871 RepID=UPI0034CDBD5E